MEKSKTKLFLENFFVYGIGGIFSKIVPIIMIPIITRLMPSSKYYGISDMSNTLISFASAFAMLGMYDGLFRIYFEDEDSIYKRATCSTALFFTIISSFFVAGIMILSHSLLSQWFFKDINLSYIVIIDALAILFGTTNRIVAAPTRLQNKKTIYLAVNIISPILSYAIAIPMLLCGYYTIALPLAALISVLLIEIYYFLINRQWFSIHLFDSKILKQLLWISLPLLPSFLIYWVFNSSDRLMITNILGLDESGIYSIAAKLGHCSQLLYTAFAGGWSYFVFSTMKDDNQIAYNSKLFEFLGIISFSVTIVVCILAKPLFAILFPQEYFLGFIASPYLFLCPLLQMLFQITISQFTIIKKTWYNTIILFAGAVVNVLLNLVLIPLCGIEGAAIATLCGYSVTVIISLVVLIKKKLFLASVRLIVCTIVFALFFIAWRATVFSSVVLQIIVALVSICIFILFYQKEIKTIWRKVCKKVKKEG